MAIQPYTEQEPYEDDRPEIRALERVTSSPHPTKRSRFATHRRTKNEGIKKQRSILRRFGRTIPEEDETDGNDAYAKKVEEPAKKQPADTGDEAQGRTIYFNRPLPESARDEEGHPNVQYSRNKIRTAKYTPLTFVPKNLWLQFHNIANIYFLFLIILVIFSIFGGAGPGLSSVPLIVIVTITAVKDAIEDTRRTILDNELNNSPVHRLKDWANVNTSEDRISIWRKFKKANSKAITFVWSLWKQKRAKKGAGKKYAERAMDQPRPSQDIRISMASSRQSVQSSRGDASEGVELTPVPSPRVSSDGADQRASWLSNQLTPSEMKMDGANAFLQVPQEKEHKRASTPAPKRTYGSFIDPKREPTGKAKFKKDTWKNVQVGDFVRLYNEEPIPADIVVLNTSDPDGACYIETKNLDGETNLKVRQALHAGRKIKRARECEKTDFWIESEPPHANLYQYNGAARWHQRDPKDLEGVTTEMAEPVSINNLLLRGCSIRNTEWVLGVVVFTGQDTKIMLNSGLTPSKRAKISQELNWNVLYNFGILFCMCLVAAIANGFAYGDPTSSIAFFEYGSYGGTAGLTGFIDFWAAIVLFQNLVPISLYITLEIIRTAQAYFIYSDTFMYYEKVDYPCTPKSWNISDDLGQIEYVFSDKTGTLTQNVMEFKKATIGGSPYGEAYTEALAGMQKRQGIDTEKEGKRARAQIATDKVKMLGSLRAMHDNPYLRDDEVTFVAPDFVEDLGGASGEYQKAANERFMLALALCHTVITERTPGDPPKIEFKAQSPDEAALVATARDMGFTVMGRSNDGIIVNVLGNDVEYTVLNTLEFNSSRKRMSAIMRMPDGKIVLFCKGADSVIYSRLVKGEQQELRQTTAEHLEMFAREGLRTLCIAQRELSEEQYQTWNKKHELAAAAVQDREDKLEEVSDEIEQNLFLLGGTAIEDRLQEGVPDAIALLGNAGIKLWVLTGDKVETAINIGFSCNLLNNDMDLMVIRVEDDSLYTAEDVLDKHLATFNMTGSDAELKAAKKDHEAPAPTHAVIIDGDSLKLCLSEGLRQKFLLLCKQCKSVLCCRVSPAQKAAVVAMVKRGLDVMTLSIGDGANDVAMIQEADVGVGIAGEEGRQAVMSSDFAIGQFRFLARLMLVHGRWCYRRLGETIANFFYKNIVWTFALFWYSIYNNFDCSYIFDYTYVLLYNLAFTSLAVICLGILDQDVSDKVSLAVPQLYRRGIERKEWTPFKFWMYMFDGLYQSLICFFMTYLLFSNATFNSISGRDLNSIQQMGVYLAHPTVIAVNVYILLNTFHWNGPMVGVTLFSILLVWFWTGVYTAFTSSFQFYKAAPQVYGTLTFWAETLLTVVICLLPRFFAKAFQKIFLPLDVDIIREQIRQHKFDYLNDQDAATLLIPRGPDDMANDEDHRHTKSVSSSDATASTPPEKKPSPPNLKRRSTQNLTTPAQRPEDEQPIIRPPGSSHTQTTSRGPHSQQGSDDTMMSMQRGEPGEPTYDRSADRTRFSQNYDDRLAKSFGPPIKTQPGVPGSARSSQLYSPATPGGLPTPTIAGMPGAFLESNRNSLEAPLRPSMDRPRPSFDRWRNSQDALRPSFEQSRDMTSSHQLMKVQSSHSGSNLWRSQESHDHER